MEALPLGVVFSSEELQLETPKAAKSASTIIVETMRSGLQNAFTSTRTRFLEYIFF
jgi:hypothetical protein